MRKIFFSYFFFIRLTCNNSKFLLEITKSQAWSLFDIELWFLKWAKFKIQQMLITSVQELPIIWLWQLIKFIASSSSLPTHGSVFHSDQGTPTVRWGYITEYFFHFVSYYNNGVYARTQDKECLIIIITMMTVTTG